MSSGGEIINKQNKYMLPTQKSASRRAFTLIELLWSLPSSPFWRRCCCRPWPRRNRRRSHAVHEQPEADRDGHVIYTGDSKENCHHWMSPDPGRGISRMFAQVMLQSGCQQKTFYFRTPGKDSMTRQISLPPGMLPMALPPVFGTSGSLITPMISCCWLCLRVWWTQFRIDASESKQNHAA